MVLAAVNVNVKEIVCNVTARYFLASSPARVVRFALQFARVVAEIVDRKFEHADRTWFVDC